MFIHKGIVSHALEVRSNSFVICQPLQKVRFMFHSWISWAEEAESRKEKAESNSKIIFIFICYYLYFKLLFLIYKVQDIRFNIKTNSIKLLIIIYIYITILDLFKRVKNVLYVTAIAVFYLNLMMLKKNSLEKINILNIVMIVFICFFVLYFLFSLKGVKLFLNNLKFWQEYKLISPLLKYNDAKIIEETKRPFYKDELENLVNWFLKDSGINNISLYFRDLNNWYIFGINERDLFVSASLTKVPTLMAVLKRSENEPWFLETRIKVDFPNINYYLHYPPKIQIINWNEYTIKELIDYMIKYSDNNATQILWKILWNNSYKKLYADLRINFIWENVEVVDYSSLFRILFNSSYLDNFYSEYALNVLAGIDFDYWLKKYIPLNIKIAHKFGEYSIDNNKKQLHDCWIIYYPNHPYVLCIMTRWEDYSKLEKAISNLSRYLFEKIDYIYWS